MAATTARRDVELQMMLDRDWQPSQVVLAARMKAVLGAQQALAGGEPDAAYALR